MIKCVSVYDKQTSFYGILTLSEKVWAISLKFHPIESIIKSISVYVDGNGRKIFYDLEMSDEAYPLCSPNGVYQTLEQAQDECRIRDENYKQHSLNL